MQEIKYRVEAIDRVLSGEASPMRAKIGEELCYLQLRMICELIAIGCLIVHGSLKPKADLFRTNKADWIMGELAKLHPKFYPTALKSGDRVGSDGLPGWAEKESGFLTMVELRKLWNRECGNRLHRGSAKNILVKDPPLEFPKVRAWRDKIVGLLERHILITADEEYILYVIMNKVGTGEVASNLFRKRDTHRVAVRETYAPRPHHKS